MDCDRCSSEAVTHLDYAGSHRCEDCLCRSVEKRIRRRVRDDGLVPDHATPADPVTWVVGLSGGKDSIVLLRVLHDTFAEDPRVELVALTIHEGIDGYRDESVDAARSLVDTLDLRHELVSYAEEFDIRMDEVADADPVGMAPCAYCGVFRRDLLETYATELGADLLLTGHNLDDEAQTALMNLLSGDVGQVAKHFEASLGALEERRDQAAFVQRAKPLRDVPEKEVALYAHIRDLPAHVTECPHSGDAYRGEIREILLELEERHPGTRHSILSGYEELARLAAADRQADDSRPEIRSCERCGAPTTSELCRKCTLLDAVGGEPAD